MMAILRQAAYIASLVPLVKADIGIGGFLAVGNDAPWGLPDSSFRPSSQANATGSFNIPAFNLSSSNPSLGGGGPNWSIEISLQANIALNGSTDKSLSAAQKADFTQLISMSLNNVDTTEVAKIASGNKMCGFILSGLNSNSTEDNQDDASKGGNCDFFSPQCRQDLQSAALDSATDCGSPTIPDSCNDWLGLSPSGDGVLQMVTFDFTEKLLTGSRFFTFGSAPASENDETEYDTAIRNIWPVVFTWSHTSGTPPDNTTKGASTLRCLRPNNIASGSRDPNAPKKGGNGDDGDKGNGDHPGAASINSMPSLGAMLLLTASASWFMLL